MESLSWAFIGTVIGAVVGASASIVTTVITASNARKLQQSAVALERSENAREFQRNNHLKLQETLSAAMRLTMRAHLFDSEQLASSHAPAWERLCNSQHNISDTFPRRAWERENINWWAELTLLKIYSLKALTTSKVVLARFRV